MKRLMKKILGASDQNYDVILHIFYCNIFKNLTVIYIPYSLVIPDLWR